MTINGQNFKRLILHDSYLAAEIERNLERFGASEYFPSLVIRHEHEIWAEFIEGSSIQKVNKQIVAKVAEFYATVYARQPRYLAAAETPFPHRLYRDLRFLNQIGVLVDDAHRQLGVVARRLIPERIWIGFDYTDPVLKNFIIKKESNQIAAIDIESLQDNQLIGTGIAKACVHWLEPFRASFFDHLAHEEVPDFQSYFSFIELCFLARWMKTKFLTKKWKFVDPALFDRFRRL